MLSGDPFRSAQLNLQRVDDGTRDRLLQVEYVGELSLVRVRPQLIAVGRIDEERGHADPASHFPNAALEDDIDVQSLRDFIDAGRPPLECIAGRARGDPQPVHPRERVNQFLGHAVAEVLVVLSRADVDERQHRDRPRVGTRPLLARLRRLCQRLHGVQAMRPLDPP